MPIGNVNPLYENAPSVGRESIERIRQLALVGAFDPVERVVDLDFDAAKAVLIDIDGLCDEVQGSGDTRWMMKPEVRKEIFRTLGTVGDLLDLVRATKPEPGDDFGLALRRALATCEETASDVEVDPHIEYHARVVAGLCPAAAGRAEADPEPVRKLIEERWVRSDEGLRVLAEDEASPTVPSFG